MPPWQILCGLIYALECEGTASGDPDGLIDLAKALQGQPVARRRSVMP
jgi:hypothetical protein